MALAFLRIIFAVIVVPARFKEYGLVLAGGLLLLWVAVEDVPRPCRSP